MCDATVTTTVSGDLRQSLQVILTAHDVLARRVRSSEEQAQLTLIKRGVMRMAATLDQDGDNAADCAQYRLSFGALLDDSMVRMVMYADGVTKQDLWTALQVAYRAVPAGKRTVVRHALQAPSDARSRELGA